MKIDLRHQLTVVEDDLDQHHRTLLLGILDRLDELAGRIEELSLRMGYRAALLPRSDSGLARD